MSDLAATVRLYLSNNPEDHNAHRRIHMRGAAVPITYVVLKDGSSITVNPLNPRECHTITRGLLGLKVRCAATGAVRRIPWRRINRHGEAVR